jgi:autotransporter-associated beta strand protein
LIQATQVRPNGATPVSSIAYFNGGTLQATASSASYLQVSSMVMSNGLVLDDNGFELTINSVALQDGDGLGGGFIKKGSGKVYLDSSSTYTGTTVVTNGTLAGIGSVIGPVVVAPAGTLGAGDAAGVGTFTINNNLTLQGKAALRVSKTGGTPVQDNVTVSGNINYTGSTLMVTNITSDATPLTVGDTFQLFSVSGSVTGAPSVIGSPGAGLAFSFNSASGVLSVVAGGPSGPATLTNSYSGGVLSLSWPAGQGWRLQMQTNSLSTTNWSYVTDGSISSTNVIVDPTKPTTFFRLVYP